MISRKQKGPIQLMGAIEEWRKLGSEILIKLNEYEMPRLEKIRALVENDAKLPMPPIRIVPYGWESPTGVIYANIKPIAFGNNNRFTVIVPVSTLFIVDDDIILRKIICHEFAHCFGWRQQIYILSDGFTKIPELTTLSPQLTEEQAFKKQGEIDSIQLVNPEEWFGEGDAKNFMPEGDHSILEKYTTKFIGYWLYAGLPIQTPKARFNCVKISMDIRILEHLNRLKKAGES